MNSLYRKYLRPILAWCWHRFPILRYYVMSYRSRRCFKYDRARYLRYAGVMPTPQREAEVAKIVMGYHVVEKGLTMPNRHLFFGRAAVLGLADLVTSFVDTYGEDGQVTHAIGVLKAYDELHKDFDRTNDPEFWKALETFLARFPEVPAATQPHTTRQAFYAHKNDAFPEFARSRHTLRHYAGPLDIEKVRKAVALAQEVAPSACNRQHTRVYCVSDHALRDKILALQNGNRGFGHLADKLLVVAIDLADMRWIEERNDGFTNGGMFLMTLCNTLHYYEVAHCILNWSVDPGADRAIRKLLPIQDSETVIAILSCGEAPEEFDVASSPRKPVETIYREV